MCVCVCAHRKAAGRRIINYNVKVRSVNLGRTRRKIESVVWGLADFVLRDLEKYQNYIEISLSGVLSSPPFIIFQTKPWTAWLAWLGFLIIDIIFRIIVR